MTTEGPRRKPVFMADIALSTNRLTTSKPLEKILKIAKLMTIAVAYGKCL